MATTDTARLTAAMDRLGITAEMATLVIGRDTAACEIVEGAAQAAFDQHTCPEPAQAEWAMACVHLRRLWHARDYLKLARAGAPITGAWPCDCTDGKFYSGGGTVNGRYTGKVGQCYRCRGKAWQSERDRQRNRYYDQHVRTIPA